MRAHTKPAMTMGVFVALVIALVMIPLFMVLRCRYLRIDEWSGQLTRETIQWIQISREFSGDQVFHLAEPEEETKVLELLGSIRDRQCSRTRREKQNLNGYRLTLSEEGRLWIFRCHTDGGIDVVFPNKEISRKFGCQNRFFFIHAPELWSYIVDTADAYG